MGFVRKFQFSHSPYRIPVYGTFNRLTRFHPQKLERDLFRRTQTVKHRLMKHRFKVAHIETDRIIGHAPAVEKLFVPPQKCCVELIEGNLPLADERRNR